MAVSARYVHKQLTAPSRTSASSWRHRRGVLHRQPGEGVATFIEAEQCRRARAAQGQARYDAIELSEPPLADNWSAGMSYTYSGSTALTPAWRARTRSPACRRTSRGSSTARDGLRPGGERSTAASTPTAAPSSSERRLPVPRGRPWARVARARHPDHAPGQHDQLAARVLRGPRERRSDTLAHRDGLQRRPGQSRWAATVPRAQWRSTCSTCFQKAVTDNIPRRRRARTSVPWRRFRGLRRCSSGITTATSSRPRVPPGLLLQVPREIRLSFKLIF